METTNRIKQALESVTELIAIPEPQQTKATRKQQAFLLAMAEIKLSTWYSITPDDAGTFRQKFEHPENDAATAVGITMSMINNWKQSDPQFNSNYDKTIWITDDAVMVRIYRGVTENELAAIMALLEMTGF